MTLRVDITVERWPLREPFEIARAVMHDLPLIGITLTDRYGYAGRAEAAGVDYDGETPATMSAQIDAVAAQLHDDLRGVDLLRLLPAGGARNALDCALWDLRAKQSGIPAWASAGLPEPKAVITAFTLGLGSPEDVRRRARAARGLPLIKLKVDAHRHLELLRVVREELPDARIVVDANQAWTVSLLDDLMPDLFAAGVELIEQPLPRGADEALSLLQSPIPLCADESVTDRASLPALQCSYQAVNIKLDKCGGLTEALALVGEARARGFHIMVGNMCGTSLGMAPAFLVAQAARWADLDGPLLQVADRTHAMTFSQGVVQPPHPALWG
ncbi:N-acetyl-D-Glu racemase DgcA [Roseateles toxinivorans]|uniref:Dipeptide epimerase n=1 Tax=Roseateles toxinivorans TaxID=270368 RepID=A0A4R6QET2_9BURK|nr:N-acetyl-D-Glu racemase DgcA [Roseateles toxinivorans]TDP61248.1 L-alanine-DL-glutamate epimerase-like enolase superfamily enzyme [Roseateles toxinivorans]